MDHVLCHWEIPADDPEALSGFYTELFGWKIEKFPGPMDYWMIETGGDGVNGGMIARQHPEHRPTNYIHVESVDEFSEKVKQLGGQVVHPKQSVPDIGWFAVCVDPQGNCFALWEAAEES